MTAQSKTPAEQINELLKQRTSALLTEFPSAKNWVQAITTKAATPNSQSVAALASENFEHAQAAGNSYATISQEEYFEVLQKLDLLLQNPTEVLSQEAQLYMEQQLSDLLGFQVSTELQQLKLPHTVGCMIAGKHHKRFPTDTLKDHVTVREASIATTRSSFGWLSQLNQISEEHESFEQYGIAIALAAIETFGRDRQRLSSWFKYRKLLIVNPTMRTFVVCVVSDICVGTAQQQFVGSPELVRASKCWSPGNAGKIIAFFIDDTQNSIPVGPVATIFNTNHIH